MPLPRYERELEERASPLFQRAFLLILFLAILIGAAVGVGWILTVLARP